MSVEEETNGREVETDYETLFICVYRRQLESGQGHAWFWTLPGDRERRAEELMALTGQLSSADPDMDVVLDLLPYDDPGEPAFSIRVSRDVGGRRVVSRAEPPTLGAFVE